MNSHPIIAQKEIISNIIIELLYSRKHNDKNLNFDVKIYIINSYALLNNITMCNIY